MRAGTASPAPAAAGVVAIGAARGSFETAAIWEAQEGGPDRWEEEARLSRQLAAELAGVAAEACRRAGVAGPVAAGCAIGTAYGFGHVAEGIDRRLAAKGPAWLEPESFVYSPAHIVAALACVELRLSGAATTFVGPRAGEQALGEAARALRLGRCDLHLAGTYEAVTPAAAAQLARLGVDADPGRAEAEFVLLARAEGAAR